MTDTQYATETELTEMDLTETDLPQTDLPQTDLAQTDLAQTDLADGEDALDRLLTGFRMLQMHHARVLHHESLTRGLNATDVRFVAYLSNIVGDGVTPKVAGEYLELTTGAMTSLIDRLVDRGFIARTPNPCDRRSVLVALTPAGAAIAVEIAAVYREAFRATIPVEHRLPLALAFEKMGTALDEGSNA